MSVEFLKEIIIGHGLSVKTFLATDGAKKYFEYEIFDEGRSVYLDCKEIKEVV